MSILIRALYDAERVALLAELRKLQANIADEIAQLERTGYHPQRNWRTRALACVWAANKADGLRAALDAVTPDPAQTYRERNAEFMLNRWPRGRH